MWCLEHVTTKSTAAPLASHLYLIKKKNLDMPDGILSFRKYVVSDLVETYHDADEITKMEMKMNQFEQTSNMTPDQHAGAYLRRYWGAIKCRQNTLSSTSSWNDHQTSSPIVCDLTEARKNQGRSMIWRVMKRRFWLFKKSVLTVRLWYQYRTRKLLK